MGELIKLVIGICFFWLTSNLFEKSQALWRIEVDETAIVVHTALRSVQTFKWERAGTVEISSVGTTRILLFKPQAGNGVEPGIDPYFRDGGRGYRLCEIADFQPSEEDFLTALERHGGVRFRP